jgi:hypothetical protein
MRSGNRFEAQLPKFVGSFPMRLARETEIFTKKGTDNGVRNSFKPAAQNFPANPGPFQRDDIPLPSFSVKPTDGRI